MYLIEGETVFRKINNRYKGPAQITGCRQSRPNRYVYDLLYYEPGNFDAVREEFNVPERELGRRSELRQMEPMPVSDQRTFQRINRNTMFTF